ncbi:LOW QUALITY PROTEIN: blastoderm-specific protein 25D, partial [Pectinophora gossypiella]|uniref:LOW QUALITY PROTEIN: blastoderm-specific protein 25D n=1 Tax=Pectinophora gossypiella TaxID=13191 RepID=UPI00214EE920
MDSTSLNQYEERLYSVFKTFDVDNEEALNKAAVLQLCDALQLEQRGAALVDTLFERRDQRVTFAQFRSGLLAVLGDPPPPSPPLRPETPPPPSDDDSSGREVAPKFVFGSKKYGRRSRPTRVAAAPAPAPPPAEPPPVAPVPAALDLDHESRVDCDGALRLCRRLHMDGIDRRLVERIFESSSTAETTVGEFFDRLNASLTSSIGDGIAEDAGAAATGDVEAALPAALVVEEWERVGVPDPRRLLAELGFDAAALVAAELNRALDDELRALAEPPDARTSLTTAALALARLRLERVRRAGDVAAAERDRMRLDVDEANRRARILAQEVDENHARLEAELTATLRRTEVRHAEAARFVERERLAERERAAAERAELEAELARRADAEQRLRAEADVLRERLRAGEARAAAAEARAAAAEREGARLAAAAQAAEARAGGAQGAAAQAGAALAAAADELRRDNARLRDRCDELAAQLEARARPRPPAAAPHTWHEEAGAAPVVVTVVAPSVAEGGESPPVSLDLVPLPATTERPASAGEPDAREELAALRARLEEADARHRDEKIRLEDLVKELETSLEQMRVEYERCEEYWSGKLEDERELLAEEQRAGDERLAELVAKVAEYERQYAGARLPPIPEAPALERQAAELEAELARARRRHADLQRRDADLQRRDAELQRRDAELQRREAELQCRHQELQRRRDDAQRRERDLARLAAGLDTLRRVAVSTLSSEGGRRPASPPLTGVWLQGRGAGGDGAGPEVR